MDISSKHQNQDNTTLQSFVGGLNTSSPSEFIDATQLAECINMEINGVGLLRTVKGTIELGKYELEDEFKAAAFDSMNEILILFTKKGTTHPL